MKEGEEYYEVLYKVNNSFLIFAIPIAEGKAEIPNTLTAEELKRFLEEVIKFWLELGAVIIERGLREVLKF